LCCTPNPDLEEIQCDTDVCEILDGGCPPDIYADNDGNDDDDDDDDDDGSDDTASLIRGFNNSYDPGLVDGLSAHSLKRAAPGGIKANRRFEFIAAGVRYAISAKSYLGPSKLYLQKRRL